MRAAAALRLGAALWALALLGWASAAVAAVPAPIGLRAGGDGAWQSANLFRLEWANPPGATIAAVHLRVLDEGGGEVLAVRFAGRRDRLEGIRLPRPGRFRAEVALEGAGGERGPAEAATLRFDDVAPGPVAALAPAGWIGAGPGPLVRIGRPPPPLPVSGILGYAVSVDRDPWGSPCAARERCLLSELDLAGGAELDSLRLEALPEGSLFLHAVAVSGSGLASSAVGTAPLRVDATPPVVRVEGAGAAWSDRAVAITAVAEDALSGMGPSGGGEPRTSLAVDGGTPATAPGPRVDATLVAEGAHRIDYFARDAAGNLSEPRTAIVRIDRTPPRVAFADRLDPREPEAIVAHVADALSGPAARGGIAIRPAGSGRRFEPLPTVATAGRLSARWDSDAYPPGTYELRATGFDAAGNAAVAGRRENGTAMVLPNPLKERSSLLSGFGAERLVWHRCRRRGESRRCRRQEIEAFARRPGERTVPHGRRLLVGGRLAAGGRPLGAAAIRVTEVFDAGADRPARRRLLWTRANGSFATRLSPGPSRRVSFEFPGDRLHAASSGRELRVAVRARVSMRASSPVAAVGGRPVLFRGRVADAGAIPPQGKSVELQFRLPGMEWTQFRTIRTGPDGAFAHAYAFADDDSRGVRFMFRAFVPAEVGWPYEPAASRPLAVRGG